MVQLTVKSVIKSNIRLDNLKIRIIEMLDSLSASFNNLGYIYINEINVSQIREI